MSYVPPPSSAAAPGSVPNHMAWAIISTVVGFCLCCPALITGIVAIVFSSKVNGLLNQGDLDGARRASAQAKTWCWVTTALAGIGLLINIYVFSTGGMEQYMQMMEQVQQAT
jgi:Interferon-induced transmembrane protein